MPISMAIQPTMPKMMIKQRGGVASPLSSFGCTIDDGAAKSPVYVAVVGSGSAQRTSCTSALGVCVT